MKASALHTELLRRATLQPRPAAVLGDILDMGSTADRTTSASARPGVSVALDATSALCWHLTAMRVLAFSLVLLATSLGCADVSAIEDGKAYGPVVTISDLFTSCHVLDAGDEVVLFDSCWREGTLVAGLRSQGFAPEQVTHVLMTHGHQDHAGGLRALPNAEVLGFEGEQANLTEHAESAGQIDRALTDGERLTFGEHTVDVIAAFGHSPGSAVYVVGGIALIGDVGLVTANGQIAPAPEDRSEDAAEAARALGRLDGQLRALDQPIDFVVPSHSGAVEGLDALGAFQPSPG